MEPTVYRDFKITISKVGYPPDVGYRGMARLPMYGGKTSEHYLTVYGGTEEDIYWRLRGKIDRWHIETNQ